MKKAQPHAERTFSDADQQLVLLKGGRAVVVERLDDAVRVATGTIVSCRCRTRRSVLLPLHVVDDAVAAILHAAREK